MSQERISRVCRIVTVVVSVVALLMVSGTATAQLQTGDLHGEVMDDQGKPVPAATMTLTGVGPARIQYTNAEGQYRFLGLSPGKYELVAALDGFNTVEYPDVVIAIGKTAVIEVLMTAVIEETITVTAEAPLLDERRVHRGVNVSVEELDKIPTARDPWSLLNQAPGVMSDRINVGGNESGQQSVFQGTGAVSTDNTMAVDGVILTDMSAVGASMTYFDFGAFEEIQFTTGSSDVSVITSGVTINQVTKRGTNDWQASGRYLRTDGDLQSTPTDVQDRPGNEIDVVEEYGAEIGGPLWRDRMWIWASFGESDIGNCAPGAGATADACSNSKLQLDRTQLEDFNTKLSFQIGTENSGVVHYWTNDKIKDGRGASPTRAPETTHDQKTPADIWKVEDTHIPGSNFFVTGIWSHSSGEFTLTPKGGLDADVYHDGDGVLHGSYYDFAQTWSLDQWRLDASYFFDTGKVSHELKFGGGFREMEAASETVWPRGKMVYSCELFGCSYGPYSPLTWVQMWRNKSVAIESSYDSAWIQDTMNFDRVTVNVGLRYDKQKVANLPSGSPAHEVIPDLMRELSFPGNDAGGFEWESVVPRAGVTYALGEHRKTLLRGTFSQYSEQLGHNLARRTNPLGYSYVGFFFLDYNYNLVLDDDEIPTLYYPYYYNFDPSDVTGGATLNVTDPDLDPMKTTEVTFGAEHSFTPNLVAGVTLTWRQMTDVPESQQLIDDGGVVRLATAADYSLAGDICADNDCVLPDGTMVTGGTPYYDLDYPAAGKYYTNGSREQEYLGITFTVNKRLADRWSLRGHLTWSDWTWDIPPEFFALDDPTDTTNDSSTSELFYGSDNDGDVVGEVSTGSGSKNDIWANSRWQLNLTTLYQVAPDRPWGFNLSASFTAREGFPSPTYYQKVGRHIQVGAFDRFRNDDIYYLDGRIDKDFEFGDVNLTLSLDGFNLLNDDAVLQRERNLAAGSANAVRERLSPRVFRLGVKFSWR